MPSALRALATRWPPEIICWSCPVLLVVASSATGVLVVVLTSLSFLCPAWTSSSRRGTGLLSVEVVDRVLHVVGQPQCVVSDQALGELGVPRLERLDDVHVVDDRALGPIVLADGATADRAHVDQQVLGHVQDQR